LSRCRSRTMRDREPIAAGRFLRRSEPDAGGKSPLVLPRCLPS
jgi:hypothetical protein